MLPHGYEGQGPEHSSARLERFMQLAADTNMQIVQPTTASQIFHVLRRQMVRNLRKPLIILTPKSLLRAKDAASPLSEFTKGGFQTVIPENKEEVKADKVKRVIGLLGQGVLRPGEEARGKGCRRRGHHPRGAAVPVPAQGVCHRAEEVPQRGTDIVWCQDEPQNQGAWFFVQHYIHENMLRAEAGLLRPRRIRVSGGGLLPPAPGAAKGFGGRCIRQAQGLCADQVRPHRQTPTPHTERIDMAIVEVKVPQLSESVAEATCCSGRKRWATPSP
jgi:2-oxoglutarate dehydrogenase complex dehydrogenase (E1) component-like enzyme